MDPSSVKKLVWSARAGDQEAYSQLMAIYYKPIYLLCLGHLGDGHDAEDVTQEVFLKGYTKLAQLKKPARFGAWIGQIAKNQCNETLRGHRPQAGLAHEPAAPGSREETYQELRELIERMPKELRVPLVMYYFDGRKVKTVAEMMSISVSNAYSRIRQATQVLQDLFNE